MAFAKLDLQQQQGVLDRVLVALGGMVANEPKVDIITFAESPDYLGLSLYPRQRLALKLYYRLPLSTHICWCRQNKLPQGYAPVCGFCRGSGTYDELADVRYLLSCENRYARLYWPDFSGAEAAAMTDEQLREALLKHAAFVFELVGGRRGSKSVLGAIVAAYEAYGLIWDPNPHATWNIIRQEIGVANAATDEEQAKILYGQMIAMLEASPWFRRHPYRVLETKLEFIGRRVFAKALHSNSSSIRGQALKAINIDEYWHFNKTTGKLSDRAMWSGLTPSVLTFHSDCRIMLTSSPVNKVGVMWEIMDMTMRGTYHNAIVMQVATWELNPNYPRNCDFINSQYALDPDYAESEYGAQIVESVGYFIPWDAIDATVNRENKRTPVIKAGVRYHMHVDMSNKRDPAGLHVCHYERETGTVVSDLVYQWDPKDPHSGVTNEYGEIDHDRVFDFICGNPRSGEPGLLGQGYRFATITFDQFNSAGLIQRIRTRIGDVKGDICFQVNDNDKTNRESYSALRSVITQGMYRCYEHPEYKRQLKALARTVKDSGTWKVEAPPGDHDDLTDAAAMAVMLCLQYAQTPRSAIHVVETGAPLPTNSPQTPDHLLPDLTLFPHLPGCTDYFCEMHCPFQQALLRGLVYSS